MSFLYSKGITFRQWQPLLIHAFFHRWVALRPHIAKFAVIADAIVHYFMDIAFFVEV